MIKNEYSAVTAAARATLKAGFNLAVTVAVLSHANAGLPKAPDVAVFLRNRQWHLPALHMYRAPETVMRSYFGDTLGGDFKKATASRGFTNGRLLYARHAALVEQACAIPAGRNEAWSVADKVKALVAALAAEGVRSEAELCRFVERVAAEKPEKTAMEKAAAALKLMLQHGAGNGAFFTLAISACEAARAGNVERAAELLAAAGQIAPQAPGDDLDLPAAA